MTPDKSFKKRYRAIHCTIWNDDKFPFCGDDAQAVFFHLLTSPMSGPFGLFKAGIGALSDERRWQPERYRKGFAECMTNGFAKFDETNLVVWVPNVIRYNPPANPNVVIGWGRTFQAVPDSQLKAEAYGAVKGLCDGLGQTFPEAFRKGFVERYANTETRNQGPEEEACEGKNLARGLGASVSGDEFGLGDGPWN